MDPGRPGVDGKFKGTVDQRRDLPGAQAGGATGARTARCDEGHALLTLGIGAETRDQQRAVAGRRRHVQQPHRRPPGRRAAAQIRLARPGAGHRQRRGRRQTDGVDPGALSAWPDGRARDLAAADRRAGVPQPRHLAIRHRVRLARCGAGQERSGGRRRLRDADARRSREPVEHGKPRVVVGPAIAARRNHAIIERPRDQLAPPVMVGRRVSGHGDRQRLRRARAGRRHRAASVRDRQAAARDLWRVERNCAARPAPARQTHRRGAAPAASGPRRRLSPGRAHPVERQAGGGNTAHG